MDESKAKAEAEAEEAKAEAGTQKAGNNCGCFETIAYMFFTLVVFTTIFPKKQNKSKSK